MKRGVSLLTAGLLVAPFGFALIVASSAELIGFALGRDLATWIGGGQSARVILPAPAAESITASESATVGGKPRAEPSRPSGKPGRPSGKPSRTPETKATTTAAARDRRSPPAPQGAVYVGAQTVLRLANAGVRPTGIAVGKNGRRPAGLELRGVSALGLGPADGDVVTSVQGGPVSSVVDVVRAVLVSRAKGTLHVVGQAWRRGQEYSIIVEMPYPTRPSANPVDSKPGDPMRPLPVAPSARAKY